MNFVVFHSFIVFDSKKCLIPQSVSENKKYERSRRFLQTCIGLIFYGTIKTLWRNFGYLYILLSLTTKMSAGTRRGNNLSRSNTRSSSSIRSVKFHGDENGSDRSRSTSQASSGGGSVYRPLSGRPLSGRPTSGRSSR